MKNPTPIRVIGLWLLLALAPAAYALLAEDGGAALARGLAAWAARCLGGAP